MSEISSFHYLWINICWCECVGWCLNPSRVKVRVGEYDASGFNPPETRSHIEYTVSLLSILFWSRCDSKKILWWRRSDILWISSGVEDCPPPSVWCKAPQRRHCCDDHNQSYWWETFCFSVFVVFNKNVVDFLPHAIVFFTRPAAPICLPRLFPFLSTTVWLCL